MLVSLSTDICPIVIPDTYGSGFQYEVADDMWDDFKQLMIDKAKDAIEYALDDIGIPYRKLEMGKFNSPREYNFTTDWIDFSIEVPDDYIQTIRWNVRRDENAFFKFARKNFGSYDGFISSYPYYKDEFYDVEGKDEYILAMWIMYRMDNENDIEMYQNAYIDDVYEYANGNGYMEYEEDDYE